MSHKRFEIAVSKTEVKCVTIIADSPDEALRRARIQNPGWRADEVDEMKGGEVVESHSLAGECDLCSKMVWDERGIYYSDDITLCKACLDSLREEQQSETSCPVMGIPITEITRECAGAVTACEIWPLGKSLRSDRFAAALLIAIEALEEYPETNRSVKALSEIVEAFSA